MSQREERVPPHNLEAEASVLGAVLLNNDVLSHLSDHIDKTDFYRTGNQLLYETMTRMSDRGLPVDVVTLVDALRSSGELDKAGGASYLADLTSQVPSVEHAIHYAQIVRKLAVLRRLIWTATEIASEGYQAGGDVDEYVDRAEKAILDAAEKKRRQSFVSLKEMLKDAFAKIEELHARKEAVTGVPSGFYDLDDLTAGFQPSDLIIVAGRPGMGKTSFMLNVAQYAAVKHNVPVGFFSLEMSKEQLVMRLLCAEAHVDAQRLRRGMLRDDDWPKLTRAAGVLAEAPIFIDDTPAISTFELRAKARRLYAEHKVGMVVIDYLQLMRASGKYDLREQEISEISRSLKSLAKELSIPVVALSQLNRGVESRTDKRPMISDLRESGAIEQDADVVVFVYREEVYEKDKPEVKGLAELIIGKQRQGPQGIVKLAFKGEHTKFENLDRRYE